MKNYNNYLYEYLNKETSQLFKYLNATQDDKYIDLSFNSPYLLQDFIDTIDPDDYGIGDLLEEYDEDNINELIYEFEDYETNINHKNFLIKFGEYCRDNITDWYDIPTNMVFENPIKEKRQWLLYETKDKQEAGRIWGEGFEYGEDNFDKLHLRNSNTQYKTEYGHYIGYNIDDFNTYGTEYIGYSYKLKHGKELLMFKSPGIHVHDFSREEDVTIFWGRAAYDIIWLEHDDDDKYFIDSRVTAKRIIERESYEDLINWVNENFEQYREHLTSDNFDRLEAKRLKRKKMKKARKFNL
jgi:hypothetical protein